MFSCTMRMHLQGYLYALGDLHRVVVHEDNVGIFNGGVCPSRPSRCRYQRESTGVVDAVADEGELAAAFELESSISTLSTLPPGSSSL